MATTYVLTDGSNRKITCQALTFGYIYDIEQNIIQEDMLSSVKDGTGLSDEEIRAMLSTDVRAIWDIIKRETYPQLFNEDGSEKEIEITDDEDDKKKL